MDVVWFAEIKWDYLRTRKQQIIRRRPDDVRVLFLEPYVRGRSNSTRRVSVDGIETVTVPFIKAVPRGPARGLVSLGVIRRRVDARASRHASRHIRAAGIDTRHAVAVISNIYAARAAMESGLRPLVYDCNDAHGDFPGMADWTRGYFRDVCRGADAVFVTASALRDTVVRERGNAGGVERIGNGVEFSHFDAVRRETPPASPGAPVTAGYLGAIAPWFDFEAVETLARARPEWRVELVGPVMLGVEPLVRHLESLPNVSVHPPVSYDDVPRAMAGWNLGMIPFRINALTRAVNPNKMYEYLAMGVPVAATPFSAEVMAFPGLVWTSGGDTSFVGACDAAVQEGVTRGTTDFEQRAVEVARNHDWSSIASEFWTRLRSLSQPEGA